jgi:two-component sensor histidine kinase
LIEWVISIARARRTGVSAWLLAGAFLIGGVGACFVLARQLDKAPFVTLFPAVAAATLFCGWRQGVAVMALAAVAAWYVFLPPAFSFALEGFGAFQVVIFLIDSALLILLVEGLAQAVQRLDNAAQVNQALFRELQHRVANNLQIVAATLHKTARGIEDPAALEAIRHATVRVHSMAGLHRRLYDAAAYAQGLEPILGDLVAECFRDLAVEVRLDVQSRDLTVGEMTAIALLVNEAAINAAKHVFRPGRGALFEVSLAEVEPGLSQLTIRDDGPGLSPEALAAPQAQRFGLAVMRGLAGQLGGTLETPEGQGTTLSVVFPHAALSGPGQASQKS